MKDAEFASFSPPHDGTDQKVTVHVNLIEREVRRAGIELGSKLAMRLLSEMHETTLLYPPAGGKQGRPRGPHPPRGDGRHSAPHVRRAPARRTRPSRFGRKDL